MKYLLHKQETERLKFRLLENRDFNDWVPLFTAKDSAVFLGLDPALSERELCKVWFDKVFDRYRNNTGGMNVLIDKITGKMVGQCGILIQNINGTTRFEVGYSILPHYWNKGYATEAALKCKNFAFKNKFTDNLMSMVHVNNISSEMVALKNGMQFENRMKNYEDKGDFNIFSIHRKLWLKKT